MEYVVPPPLADTEDPLRNMTVIPYLEELHRCPTPEGAECGEHPVPEDEFQHAHNNNHTNDSRLPESSTHTTEVAKPREYFHHQIIDIYLNPFELI